MSKMFLISYDLRKVGQNYSDLYTAIKSFVDWQHPLESVWVVQVGEELSANDIYNRLKPNMDEGDLLLIVELSRSCDHQGWLSKTFWEWFNR